MRPDQILRMTCLAVFLCFCAVASRAADIVDAQPVSIAPAAPTGLGAPAMQKGIEDLLPDGFQVINLVMVPMPSSGAALNRLYLEDPQIIAMLNEFHCTSIIEKTFQRGHRKAFLQAYCFADPLGAYAAYTAVRRGASTVVTRGDGSSEDDQSISFWQNNYFIRLFTDAEDDEEAKILLRSLADSLTQYIPEHAVTPSAITALPRWGKVAGSEHVVMGSVSGRRFLSVPLLAQLHLDRARSAVVVDYQFSKPNAERMKLLAVDYGSHNLANNTFHSYIEALEESHKRKYECSGLSCLVGMPDGHLLCLARGNYLIVISGARKRIAAYMLAKQFDYYVGEVVH